MYTEIILDLYKNPRNKGQLKNPTHESERNNPLCGDEIKLQLQVKNNQIKDVKFSGNGCAISQASASLLTDKLKNLPIEEAKSLNKETVLDLLHIPISPARMKCALLSLETLKEALENKNQNKKEEN
jgi:nitrogen fixation NifU-like protein|tara:strand:+ start:465 stop:845 length:381 start_codon:yes stop_codon:yes gene_type:complete